MTSINATSARSSLYKLISHVNESSEPVTITNARGKNAVLLSEEDWNALQETLFLSSLPEVKKEIVEGMNTPLGECVAEEKVDW